MTNILFLADFSVIRPEPGLLIWTIVIFAIFWYMMAKFAFKPIQQGLKKREDDIRNSLQEAQRARDEVANMQAKNEALLAEAREERSNILKEAKAAKENIINEAKEKAKEEAQKIVANARRDIENQRLAAITDLKNQSGKMAIQIAELLLRKELADKADQESYVKSLVDEIKMN